MRGSSSKSRFIWALISAFTLSGLMFSASARPTIARGYLVQAQAFFRNGSLTGELYLQEEAPQGGKGPITWYVGVGIRNELGQLGESGGGYYPFALAYDPMLRVVHGTGDIPTQYSYTDSFGSHALPSHVTFDVTWRATTPPRWLNGSTPQIGTAITFDRQAKASGFMASPYVGRLSEPIPGNDAKPVVVTYSRQIGVDGVPLVPSGVCSYDLPFPVCV